MSVSFRSAARRVAAILGRPRKAAEKPRARFALERTLELARESGLAGSFLDVGCGSGEHSAFARSAKLFGRIDGTDRAARAPRDEDRFFAGEFETLELPEAYDVVWCSHTLEHSLNPGMFIAALKRAAKDGGLDCSRARIKTHGYNVSIVLAKRECEPCSSFVPDHPRSCRAVLPKGLRWTRNDAGVWYFEGDIAELNWR